MERGQAALDYLALVAVAAGALAAAGSVWPGTEAGAAVVRQLERALCVVRGGDCERDRAPCVTRARQTATRVQAHVLAIRIGAGTVALVEERSDGAIAVTRLQEADLGADLRVGLGAGLRAGDVALAIGGEARAALLAHARSAKTWHVRSAAQAGRLLDQLAERTRLVRATAPDGSWTWLPQRPRIPPPAESASDRGWSVTLAGTGRAGKVADGALTLRAGDAYGARTLHGSGRRVLYVRRSQGFDAALGGGPGGRLLRRTAGAATERVYGIEVDAHGEPVDLSIVVSGALTRSGDLPDDVQEAAGLLIRARGSGRRFFEVERHLDLTQTANLAAAREFLRHATHPRPRFGDAVAVSAALDERLRDAGTIHARVYEVGESRRGLGGHATLGVKVAGSVERYARTSRLVAALTRAAGAPWVTRGDCL